MRVALVYDRVNKIGGAERVLSALHEIWPNAPLYTSVYDPVLAPWAKVFDVRPSFLNRFSFLRRHHELLAPLMPLLFENFDLSNYDLVISVTSEAAKGVITKPESFHLCYCLTPTRYLWSGYRLYFANLITKFLSKPLVTYLRRWDITASCRPDAFVAISKTVQSRIAKYYSRKSVLLYPPVDTVYFTPDTDQSSVGEYFLIVSRLVYYKRVDLAISACSELNLPLVVVGSGSDELRLKAMAGKSVKFLGQLTDEKLLGYYRGCKALIFPTEEDFGIVPLEAQACGRPVIAFARGGASETVIPGVTGMLFNEQTVTSLKAALAESSNGKIIFQPKACVNQANKFSKARFITEFRTQVLALYQNYQKGLYK